MGAAKINETGTIQLGGGVTGNADLNNTAEAFLARLKARQQSPETIKKRRDCLRRFLLFMQAKGLQRFADVDAGTLEAFKLCLVEHAYSLTEIEATLRSTQFLFRYLEEQNLIFSNPAERLKIQKAPLTLGRVLSEKEIQRLLAAPDLTSPTGLRDRALLEVLYSTGMRRAELTGLTIYDVDLDRATVKVQGKGRKQRLIPMGRHAVKYVRLYLQEARSKFLPKLSAPSDALWLARHRKAMTHQTVCKVVNTCAAQAKLKGVDTHTLRRTCATQLLRGGAHPAVVAQILGHSGLRSLSHYLRTTITDLQKSHSQSKPGK